MSLRRAVLLLAACGLIASLGRGLSPGAAPDVEAQSAPGLAFLPMLLRGEELALLPDPPTAPPPTPTATPSPTLAVTPGPSPTPEPPRCVGGLESRPVVLELDMDGARARAPDRRGMHPRQPLYLGVVGQTARAWLAWAAEGGQVHVTPLADLQRAGRDRVLEGDAPVGLAARPDGGFAVAVIRGETVVLAAYDADGRPRWEETLLGDNTHAQPGDKWVDSWGHEGRLVWTGQHYALYLGHTQEFGAQGKHQGDLLWLFDAQGSRIDGRQAEQPSWDWGCSHSLDLRLAWSEAAEALGPVCLSDAYPKKAIMYRHRVSEVWPEPSGNERGSSDGRLGGLVPTETGFSFSFSTKETRGGRYDVALVDISAEGEVTEPLWITASSGRDEESPHHGPYGEDWLFGWHEDGVLKLSVFGRDGRLLAGPVSAPAGGGIDARDDFVGLPDGSVAWPARDDAAGSLSLVRVPYCRR